MTEKIYMAQPGAPLDDGTSTVLVAEAEIKSKARYTKEQLEQKRKALLDEADNLTKIIESMESKNV